MICNKLQFLCRPIIVSLSNWLSHSILLQCVSANQYNDMQETPICVSVNQSNDMQETPICVCQPISLMICKKRLSVCVSQSVYHFCSISSALFSTLLYGLYGYVSVTVRDNGPLCAKFLVVYSFVAKGLEQNKLTCS